MTRARGAFCAALAGALTCLGARSAFAEPVRTWGVGAVEPRPSPAPAATPSSAPGTPPPPPPSTIGTPLEGSSGSAPPAAGPAVTPIVRASGMVGLRYTLEGIEIRGNTTTLARVVLRYVHFRAGDTVDVDDPDLELTRFRLLGTGFFRDVQLSLRKGTRRGYVVLVVNVAERNTIIVDNVWLGVASDVDPDGDARPLSAYGGAAVSETNLAGTGTRLGGAFALADRQLALRTRFTDRQFLKTNYIVEAELLYSTARDFFGNHDVLVDDPTQRSEQDFAVLGYRRFGGMVGAGHDVGTSAQLFLDYRLEKLDATMPLAASHHRGLDIEPIDFMIAKGSSVLSTLRATFVYDTRNDPVLPSKGEHLIVGADASLTPLGSDYPYVKLHARASHWTRLPWGHVLRLDAFAGGVFGDAPLFERFFIGDFTDLLPGRVLDLNFDRRPAPNFLHTDIVEMRYGQYAAKLQAEYRVPIYRGTRSVYGVDVFGAFGIFGLADERALTQAPRGYTGFATVPVDLTFNLGLRISTSAGGFVLGFANVLGFTPIHGPQQGAR